MLFELLHRKNFQKLHALVKCIIIHEYIVYAYKEKSRHCTGLNNSSSYRFSSQFCNIYSRVSRNHYSRSYLTVGSFHLRVVRCYALCWSWRCWRSLFDLEGMSCDFSFYFSQDIDHTYMYKYNMKSQLFNINHRHFPGYTRYNKWINRRYKIRSHCALFPCINLIT